VTMPRGPARTRVGKTDRRASAQARPCAYSIVICTHNRAELLGDCLRAVIRETTDLKRPGEIVLVDNASTDRTREIVNSFAASGPRSVRLRYLFEHRPGLSIARNLGVHAAQGEIVIFLDDDAIPAPRWLASCLSAFEMHPTTSAIGGEIVPLLTVPPPDWFRPPLTRIYTLFSLAGGHVRPFPSQDHPFGANMAFRKGVFETRRFSENLGRVGNNLMGGEEAELCATIRRAGGEILYVPGMKVEHVVHPERLNQQWVLRRYYFEGVSRASMQVGWTVQAVTALVMATKLAFLVVTHPFLRSDFQRLLWGCRFQKSIGYFDRLIGLAHHSSRCRAERSSKGT
jgi:glycosyltransferase involved in cell wall biosynthesis